MEDFHLKDEAARTTPIGLIHYANSYWMSARVLNANRPKVTHPDEPVNFLFYQAVELFLKAFLLLHGHSARELASRKFGHDFSALGERAEALGLFLMDEDKDVLLLMGTTDAVIRSRYIKTVPEADPRCTRPDLQKPLGDDWAGTQEAGLACPRVRCKTGLTIGLPAWALRRSALNDSSVPLASPPQAGDFDEPILRESCAIDCSSKTRPLPPAVETPERRASRTARRGS
jgi:HEPN domain-containing protein